MSEERKAIATLLGLVKNYSPSGREENAVIFLVQRMQELGFGRAYADGAGNAVGVMGEGERQVVLMGHIDTVPGEIDIRIEDDVLYGRGSVDAKGPLAAFVDAVAAVGPVEGWQFVVIGAVQEESNSDGARFVVDQYQPDFTIIGEPSRWDRITLGYKGSMWAEVSITQSKAHTAADLDSACEVAFQVWQKIKDHVKQVNADHERAFDQLSPTLRHMDSGEDGFKEWSRLHIGTRLPLSVHPQDWFNTLKDIASPHEVRMLGFPEVAYRADKRNPLVSAFLQAVRSQDGKPGFVLKTGTADFNIVGPAWGCPIVAYGPGDSRLDHTPEERQVLAEYLKAVEVLKAVLSRLSGKRSVAQSEIK